jgi:hypothetical protein
VTKRRGNARKLLLVIGAVEIKVMMDPVAQVKVVAAIECFYSY